MNSGRPKILLVDDEPTQLLVGKEALRDLGLVLTADNCGEAMDLIQSVGVDVVVVDLSMNGLCGLEFIERARRVRPDLPLVVHSESIPDEACAVAVAGLPLCPKSWGPAPLRRTVVRILESGNPGPLAGGLSAGEGVQ